MFAKPGLDRLVELGNLLAEDHHLPRQRVHHVGGQLLPGQTGVLALSGVDDGLGEPAGVDDLSVTQPGLQPFHADTADGGRGLVSGQQHERAGVGQVQCPFQPGEDAGELGAEPVDATGAVGDQVRAAAGEDLEVGDGSVAGA